jgi:hypothetical protein
VAIADARNRSADSTHHVADMESVAEPRMAAGVLRPLLHVIDRDVPAIDFQGVPLWFARCGATCVPLGGEHQPSWETCADCAT